GRLAQKRPALIDADALGQQDRPPVYGRQQEPRIQEPRGELIEPYASWPGRWRLGLDLLRALQEMRGPVDRLAHGTMLPAPDPPGRHSNARLGPAFPKGEGSTRRDAGLVLGIAFRGHGGDERAVGQPLGLDREAVERVRQLAPRRGHGLLS